MKWATDASIFGDVCFERRAAARLVTLVADNPAFAFGFTPGFILTLAPQAGKR